MGYQLAGQFDLSGYASWYAQATSAYVVQASQEASTTCAHLLLNKKQSAYLDSWQKDKYPIETNLAFIESLKKRLN